jgi:hypothetical protein
VFWQVFVSSRSEGACFSIADVIYSAPFVAGRTSTANKADSVDEGSELSPFVGRDRYDAADKKSAEIV